MVMQLPDGDQTSITRKEMLARMDVCMGGRVAEELIFGTDNVSSGASSDIEQATKLAYAMVTKYGLSTKVGVMYVDDNSPKISEETKQLVEAEVRRMLDESYKRATKLLETNRKDLEVIANGLIQYETLSGGEIVDLLAGKKVDVTGIRNQRPSRALKEIPLPPAAATTKSPAAPSRGGSPPVQPGKPKIVPSKSVAAPTSSSPSSTSSNSKIVAPVTASATAPLPVVAKDASGATTVKQSSSTATTSKQSSVVEPPPDSKVK
jgi:ATP-dependent metalloprotease